MPAMNTRETAATESAGQKHKRRRLNAGLAGNGGSRTGAEAGDSTRERVVSCAGRLFAERGFESASIRDIARAAGITPGAVYKHFASKGHLLLEVVNRALHSIPLFVQGAAGDDDARALPDLAAAYTEPELKLLRQLSIEVHSASTKDRKVNRVLTRSDELAMRQIGAAVAKAQRAGRLDPSLDPDFVARAFSVFIMGLTHMDTLLPELIGNRAWHAFVRDRVAKLIGLL
jgi:AcrR family transcriptional regulator